MKRIFQITLVLVIASVLVSCNKEYEDIITDTGLRGTFVRNEAGSISYYNDVDETVTADFYKSVNGADLGAPFSALSIFGNKGYALKGALNDQKVETLDATTFKKIGEQGNFSHLTDLTTVSDTFVVVAQGVSDSENPGSVTILDSDDLSKSIATFKVGQNPTRLAYSRGKKVYVANTGGGAYPDSTVMVIDIDLKQVSDTIVLEQQDGVSSPKKLTRPVDMVIDAYQNVWVLCAGQNNQSAGLARISYGTHEVKVFKFGSEVGYVGKGKGGLAVSPGGIRVYYVNDGMYAMGINDVQLPEDKFLAEDYKDLVFNAIGVSPSTGKFFCAMDASTGAKGEVYIFDRYGIELEKTIEVGEKPRQIVFVR
ncbi:hypothetical protein SAMN06265379_101244 [Saccharicrinis carchari]|uniref:40-residue YVTN family beta-propeller repeat-containing protein n=1 Tax=Saccharicrinis carchari TaxID=1168039 RepID=A0A521AMB6_SACCC|nr:hypothetical protein [Saccharicrinis carchari]SMO35911.1 hypothetical protein SAMN06265379_101244 [Saccharicrinis carchari]